LGGDSGKQIKAFAEELRDNGYLALVPHYFGKDDGKDDGTFDVTAFEKRLQTTENTLDALPQRSRKLSTILAQRKISWA
jgi:dienelactone hydrolase